jgi:hypothetical protein
LHDHPGGLVYYWMDAQAGSVGLPSSGALPSEGHVRSRMRMQRFDNKRRDGLDPGFGLVLLLAAVGNIGCSSSANLGVGDKAVATMRSRTIDHEPCDLDSKGADRVDVNGDGRPDLTIVKNGAKELCRAADLDFDGRVDMWSYFDDGGKLKRRELDYDRDGSVDEIQLFKAGEIAEKQRASTPAKRLDTWEFYSGGRIVRAERDSDANGRVDQWWDYKTPDCPLIRSDSDGNGEPDPKTDVDYCKESGYKPPEQAAPSSAPMLKKETDALPTETSSHSEPTDKANAGSVSSGAAGKDNKANESKDISAKPSGTSASGKGKSK